MIPILLFSTIAAALVFLAGREDAARDPRLTISLLVLTGVFPWMAMVIPEIALLPAPDGVIDRSGESWMALLPWIWGTGFMVALTRLLRAVAVLHQWRKQSVEVDRIDGVAICEHANLHGPVAAGVWSPVIFVPETWRDWPAAYRLVVLEHELAHHQRRDPLWRLLAELACAVHWYHPLARWMKRRFIMQCEYACDARVLRRGIDPKTYASVLCDLACDHSTSPLAPAMAETGSLESRVRRMLKPSGALGGWSIALLGLLGIASACCLSMIGRGTEEPAEIPAIETELRWTANPFPAEP